MQLLSAIHGLMDTSTLNSFFLHYLAGRIPASVALRDLPPPCYETAGSPGAGHIYFGRKWVQPNTRTGHGTLKLPSSLMGHSLGHLLSTARGFVNAVPVFSVEMENQL